MRGSGERTGALFSYVDVESRIRSDHPLRRIREIANEALASLDGDFGALYARRFGRPSLPPERLLRAMLLQAFYVDPLGAPADGAAGVRPLVPLVRRARRR